MNPERAAQVIEYWFGDLGPSIPEKARFELWFGKKPDTDREIRERFEEDVLKAARGEYDHWAEEPESCLALIVLLDQFPRNIYRDAAGAFAFDGKARAVCREGLARGHDRKLPLFGRLFFYLPLEHSEELEDQEESVRLFKNLLEDAGPELKDTFREVYDYALRHREIIRRFGRFPHRNKVLGRASTPEEEEFLEQPGSSF